MTKLLQKIAIVLLLVMLAAAVSFGQKGRDPEGQGEKKEKGSSAEQPLEEMQKEENYMIII